MFQGSILRVFGDLTRKQFEFRERVSQIYTILQSLNTLSTCNTQTVHTF